MRLKQIKLAGFKSFADATKVPFPSQMTAIVGPNGCGKSNVIDAVRWVLGESSAKNLRGDAMTDVIFNGSNSRPASSVASVELVFDNSSGRIASQFAKFNEIAIKRQVSRDGVSSYFLNGNKCRRRDITDIFMGTGLGPRSYAIIEQGMISRLIESRPQELRVFIEEAAGISKYKERRRETENRIRHTRENLERLEDLRLELGQQLQRLQRQADAAQRYRKHKATEGQLQNQLFALRWRQHSDRMTQLEQQLAEKQAQHQQHQAAQQGDLTAILKLEQQQADLKAEVDDRQQQLFGISNEATRIDQQILNAKQRYQQLHDELIKTRQQLSGDGERRQTLEAQHAQYLEQRDQTLPELEMAQEALFELEQQSESLTQRHMEQQGAHQQLAEQARRSRTDCELLQVKKQGLERELGSVKARLAQLQSQLAEHQLSNDDELAQLEEQLQVTKEQIAELELLQETEQEQQQRLQQQLESQLRQLSAVEHQQSQLTATIAANNTLLSGLSQVLPEDAATLPKVWQQLEVVPKWRHVLDWVLGERLQGVISQDPLPGVWRFDDETCGEQVRSSPATAINGLPTLQSMVTTSLNLSPWLQGILCADTLAEAKALVGKLEVWQSVVTLDGHWLGVGFAYQVGEQQVSVLSVADELERQQQQLAALMPQGEQLREAIVVSKSELEQVARQLSQGKEQQKQASGQLMQQQLAYQKAEQQRLHRQQNKQQLELQHQELADQQQLLAEQALELELELDNALEHSEGLSQQAELAQQTLSAAMQQSEASRQQHQQQQQRISQLRVELERLNANIEGIEAQLAQQQQNLSLWQQRLEEAEEAQAQLTDPLAEWQEQLQQQLQIKSDVEQQVALLNQKLAQVEEQLGLINASNRGQIDQLKALSDAITELKMEHEGLRVQAQGQLDLLAENDVNLQQILATLPADAALANCQAELEQVRQKIKRLGAINLAAIEEYEQQSERKRYLDEQNHDLTEALETLEAAIRKIDRETRQRFKATFDEVNDGLGELFPKVFGGGSAYLALTDNDLLETGVTIMARPPGKKNATIHLLSGGEKALTALSLVFAIFRLNPAPFCMLDEVDAPLDDANVGRFCRLVKEMSESVQFIYISHNKVSMEMADQLTGVTMHEPGASRIVAVNVEEAAAMAES